jgi:hypothetical protein
MMGHREESAMLDVKKRWLQRLKARSSESANDVHSKRADRAGQGSLAEARAGFGQ